MPEKLEITECTRKNGWLTVEALYRGQYHHMNYEGYTKREALKRFRAFVLAKYQYNSPL